MELVKGITSHGQEPGVRESLQRKGAVVSGWVHDHLHGIVVVMGLSQLALGFWMAASPSSFFAVLGGFGAENAHYVRDVSTVYLALGAALLVAAARPSWRAPVLFVATLQYAVHALNHLKDVGNADPGWIGPVDVATITAAAGVFGCLFWIAREEGR